MAKTPCKGVKKDGTPCKGQGLAQFDGYCIAHAPAEKTREWRTRGGKNSSTAARFDKRIPERLEGILNEIREGMSAVRDGSLTPAQFNAICNGARMIFQLYRLGDEEMDVIRDEEIETAAREVAGAQGDPAILSAAAHIFDEHRRYWADSLIEQGLATPEPDTAHGPGAPDTLLLTDAGRRRFGLQKLTSYTQEEIDQVKAVLERHEIPDYVWRQALETLSKMRASMEQALDGLARGPEPVRDPLTGQVLSELPAGVKKGTLYVDDHIKTEEAKRILQKQLQQVERLTRMFEFRFKFEATDLGHYLFQQKKIAKQLEKGQQKKEEPEEKPENETERELKLG